MTASTPTPSRPPVPWHWIVPIVAVAAVLAGLAVWRQADPEAQARRQTAAMAQAVVDEWRKGLPRPFGQGLEVVAVDLGGMHLVVTIRSLKRLARDAARDPDAMAAVRGAETVQLLELCRNPAVVGLLGRGMTVHRRFVDARGETFFDLPLTARDCAGVHRPPARGAPRA